MRTSTVVLLVLFLCAFSSGERESKVRRAVEGAKDAVARAFGANAPAGRRCEAKRGDAVLDVEESAEVAALREQLRRLEERDDAASRALRAVDRSVRALEERARELRKEARRVPAQEEVFAGSCELLERQKDELAAEKQQIVGLRERMKAEAVQLRARIELAAIRSERREVEAFLAAERPDSPLERIEAGEPVKAR